MSIIKFVTYESKEDGEDGEAEEEEVQVNSKHCQSSAFFTCEFKKEQIAPSLSNKQLGTSFACASVCTYKQSIRGTSSEERVARLQCEIQLI